MSERRCRTTESSALLSFAASFSFLWPEFFDGGISHVAKLVSPTVTFFLPSATRPMELVIGAF